ncbi:MAG: stage II sporulation protein D [bacterium]|jgi:stage II sporulation protein D
MGKGAGCLVLFLLLVIIIVPSVLVRGCDFRVREYGPSEPPAGAVTINVYDAERDEVLEMELEKYLEGVVAGEMPVLFHTEALKAQAIAARTYAVRKMRRFGGAGDDRNLAADISSDPARDQAWLSEAAMKERWGVLKYYRYRNKIRAAVQATAGLILLYQGEPITPAYHSTCGGVTENSEDVWTYEVPYLRSVRCDYDTHSSYYRRTVSMSHAAFAEKIGAASATAGAAASEITKQLEALERSSTGRLKQVRVGDKIYRGLEFRMQLGLPSSHLTWNTTESGIEFKVQGYGHGVGMCQYGADGMAKAGKKAEEILRHYFTGAEIAGMFEE